MMKTVDNQRGTRDNNRVFLKGSFMNGENQASQIFESLLFPRIFRSFRMAIQPSKLIIAMLMITAVGLTGWIMDLHKTVVNTPMAGAHETELNIFMTSSSAQLDAYIAKYRASSEKTGVFTTLWHFGRDKFHGVLRNLFAFNLPGILDNVNEYLQALEWAVKVHPTYCVIFVVITLCIFSIFGGAICRIAALQFAREEKPGISEALRFSIQKFWSFFTTPLVPLGIGAIIWVLIFLIGILGNIPFGIGEVLVGIFMWFALLAGAIVSAVVIGTVAGFNLMFPAMAYDGSDSMDAVSRSFNYVYARPWRMGLYSFIAFIYGAICYVFVRFFAYLLLLLTYEGLRLGAGLDSARGLSDKVAAIWLKPTFHELLAYSTNTGSFSEKTAALLVYLSALVVIGLVVSFIISFYFSSNTIIYALIRNKVDNTPIEEIYTEPQEIKLQEAQQEQPSA
jgi:hypothetical protein